MSFDFDEGGSLLQQSNGFHFDGEGNLTGVTSRGEPKPEPGGLIASAKSAFGAMVKGAGQAAADFVPGMDQDNAVKRYGQSVIDANPTAIHSLSDIGDKPLTAVAEAAGNAGGSMAGMVGVRALGQGITALSPLTGPAAPAVALLGQAVAWLGPAAIAALPSYGGIRDKQIMNDPASDADWRDKTVAALGAATVGAIESKFGPQQWALGAMTKEGRAALAAKFAETTLAKGIGYGAIKGGAIEGAEEMVQNPVEQLAAYENPTTAANVKETVFGGAMGAIGGGVLGGGFGAAFRGDKPVEQSSPDAPALHIGNTPDPLISFADGTVGRRADVDAYLNTLPEDQRISARAKLSGLASQPAKADPIAEIGKAQSVDDAIAAAQDALASDQNDFDGLLQSEQRNLQVMQAQLAQDRLKQSQFDDLQGQSVEQLGRLPDQQVAAAMAATDETPTAMQMAMQRAQSRVTPRPAPVEMAPAAALPDAATQSFQYPDILPGDITRKNGQPFQSENGARLKQREVGGIDGSEIIPAAGGYVVRPKASTAMPVAAPADAAPAMQPAASSPTVPTDSIQSAGSALIPVNPPPAITPEALQAPAVAADPRLIPVSQRQEEVQPVSRRDLPNEQKPDATPDQVAEVNEAEYQQSIKDGIQQRLGLVKTPEVDQRKTPFKSFLREFGIHPAHVSDIAGRNKFQANNILPATFRAKGLNLDALVERAIERGFMQESDRGDQTKLVSLIQDEISGKQQISSEFADVDAQQQAERVQRMDIEALADQMGLPYSNDTSTDRLASMVNRVETRTKTEAGISFTGRGSLKSDRVLKAAQETVARIERKRAQYERESRLFAENSIAEQEAILEILADEDGNPVILRRAEMDAQAAWVESRQQWNEQNGQTHNPEYPAARQDQTPATGISEEGVSNTQGVGTQAQHRSAEAPGAADESQEGVAKPLYASRSVTNAADIIAWAQSQGFKTTLPADDMHVTVAYSSQPVDGSRAGKTTPSVIINGGTRTVEPLGAEKQEALNEDKADEYAEEPTLKSPTRADVAAQQERADNAAALDDKAQIDAEASRQTLTRQTAPEQRKDTSGDMFAVEKAQAVIDKRNAGVQAAKDPNQPGMFDESSDPLIEIKATLDANNITGKERLDVIKDVKSGALTAAEVQEAYPSKIDDVGEKIGGARKDTAISTGTKRKTEAQDDGRPSWAKRFQISQIAKGFDMSVNGRDITGKWTISDTRNKDRFDQPKKMGGYFDSKEEAEAALPLLAVAQKHRVTSTAKDADGAYRYEIWRDINDRKRVKVVAQDFATRDDAMRYMAQHATEILETNTTFGESDIPKPESTERKGVERRTGDVKGEDFRDAFGFRGVEFGLWNNQEERQEVMNAAYDGLMDLADVLNIPPKAIGLNGDLALAFGARGKGLTGARAHYETNRVVMNLTKMNGAGALAHEFFHALDHYLARQDGKTTAEWRVNKDGTRSLDVHGGEADMASGGFRRTNSGVREELRAAYTSLVQSLFTKAEQYVEDTARADKFVAVARGELEKGLNDLRKDLSEQKDVRYYKRNNKPASAEQLAEFDAMAAELVEGRGLSTEWKTMPGKNRLSIQTRHTNETLEKLNELYKAVRGRSGFNAEHRGVLDALSGYMKRYDQRMQMLREAMALTTKTKRVPTSFAMAAKSLDQGRGGDYWTSPHEMVARAFQGYIEDKIAARDGKSPFLNYAPENAGILTPWGVKRPFPVGEERKAMNGEFDKFVSTIQTKETEQGVAMFSRAGEDAAPEQNALQALSENDELFALPKSSQDTVAGIAADTDSSLTVKEVKYPGLTKHYTLTMPDGAKAKMMVRAVNPYGQQTYGLLENDGDMEVVTERPGENAESVPDDTESVYIDVSELKEGGFGSKVYNIAATYAHNTGRILIGDPAGLSDVAMRRRTEHMLSSALKFGTTRHLAPHPRQVMGARDIGVPPMRWTYGDDLGNIQELIRVSTESTDYAGGNPFTFDLSTGAFRDSEGGAIDDDGIQLAIDIGQKYEGNAGRTTLKRNAVLQSLVRQEGAGRRAGGAGVAVLEGLVDVGRQFPASSKGIFYSQSAVRNPSTVERVQSAVAEFIGGKQLPNQLGSVVATTAAEIKSHWEALIDKSVNIGSEGDAGVAQAFYDPRTKTVFLIADHISQGNETAVLAHELMHKHGQTVLGKDGWTRLHGVISSWEHAPADSEERAVYSYARNKVAAVGNHLSSQELFPYAVEAALKMGIQPSMAAKKGTVARWLESVRQNLQQVWGKITNNPSSFAAQDLVDLAFGIAQMENPEHAGALMDALRGTNGVMTNNDVVGNQGGRSADDSTPGASLTAEQKALALDESRWLDRGLKLSKSLKLYRGVSDRTGKNTANFGKGLYVTTDRSEARQYGSVSEMSRGDLPQNPLRFSDEGKFREWESFVSRELLGFKRGSDIQSRYTPDQWIRKYLDRSIDGIQIGTGHGAFFVRFPNESTAPDSGGAMFSRTQIIGQTSRQHTPEQLRAMANVGFQVEVPSLKERAQALWKDAGKKLAQGIVDQFAPVKALDGTAYGLLRLAKGASGAFEAFLHGGKLKLTDGVYDFDETNKGGVIDMLLIPLQGEHHDFMRWVAANRAERLQSEGKENLFSPQDIADLKTLASGTTGFDYTVQTGPGAGRVTRDRTLIYADSLRVFNAFNKNILDMAEQSGLIDGASRQVWEHEFYVPFYRVADEDGGGVRGMNIKGSVIRQQAFKELKGGKNALNADLLDNTLMNWAHLLDASAKNRAAKATIEAAEAMGAAMGGNQSTLAQMGASVNNKNGVVWFMEGGQKRYSLIDKAGDGPYLMIALGALEYSGMRNPVMNAMGAMKHALTIGVTASPFFKIRNLIRDSVQVLGTSNINPNPLANVANGWKLTDPKSDAYFRLLAGGGTIHFGTMLEGSEARRVQSLVESGVNDATLLNSEHKVKAFYRRYIEPGISAYNELGNRGEAINRASLYDQLVRGGMNHADASLQARDLMDFSMQGSFTTIRFLTQVVPFFNARLQGMYKLGRAAKEDPARFSAVVGAAAVLSIALLAAYSDDDDWKKREEWDRNNFWWFKFGGTAFRIPKPFEIGAIATLAERGFELAFDKEMTGSRFGKQVATLLGDNLSMNPVPQLVKPIVDVYANRNSFSGRPIETMSMERLKSEYRFTDRTSMTARGLSTAANSVAGLVGGETLSPVQIDHMLRGYFGWLGSFVVGAGDVIARPATGQTSRAASDMWKVATGGIISDTRDAPSRYVSQMYEQARVIEQAYGTWRSLQKEGKTLEAQEFFKENREDLSKYRRIEMVKKQESKFNERIRIIERSNMDGDAKRDLIRSIQIQKDRVARQIAV